MGFMHDCVCMHACVKMCVLLCECKDTYLSTHTVYQYKNFKNHYFVGIWPYWKMDTGKHNFHEILLSF